MTYKVVQIVDKEIWSESRIGKESHQLYLNSSLRSVVKELQLLGSLNRNRKQQQLLWSLAENLIAKLIQNCHVLKKTTNSDIYFGFIHHTIQIFIMVHSGSSGCLSIETFSQVFKPSCIFNVSFHNSSVEMFKGNVLKLTWWVCEAAWR